MPAFATQIEDLEAGTGPEAASGKVVTVHYVGTLPDGAKFDSSRDRNEPFSFTLGKGGVIRGWDAGLVGMRAGGKRRLTIPPEEGYSPQGAPPAIPPDATLVFEVEMLRIA